MKQLNCVSTVAFLLLALALPALAAEPIFIENPITPFPIPAVQGCGTFDVLVTPEEGKPSGGELIMFRNGNAVAAGPAFATLTNATTGKSINLNVSGPTRITVKTNTIVVMNRGLSLVFGAPPIAPPNLQGLALANGLIVTTIDISTGNITSISFTGRAQNLCPLLE